MIACFHRFRPTIALSCLVLVLSLGSSIANATPDSVVVFNEIHYHPPANENGEEEEWIELHNQMGIMTDVSDWKLVDGVEFTIPKGTIIPPGGYLVIAKSPGANQLGPFDGSLGNQGERLRLVNQSGRLMDEMEYQDGGRWPVDPDGSGASLAKLDKNQPSGPPEQWTVSAELGGTPGTSNFPKPNEIELTTTRVFDEKAPWRYNESGSDLGPDWASQAHPDGGDWGTGPGAFGFEPKFDDQIGTRLTFPALNETFVTTYYFETDVEFSDDLANRLDHLLISHFLDDGAIFYINGQEVLRHNMPNGDVTSETLAPGNIEAEWVEGVRVPSAAIVPGENRISVELHQAKVGSSDFVFGMRLDMVTRPPTVAAETTNIVLNEMAPAVDGAFWLELKNSGDTAEDAGGLVVSISNDPGREVIVPAGTILEPGGHHLIPAESFSFPVVDRDRIFLFSSDRSTLLDARGASNSLRGLDESPGTEWFGEWLFPAEPTPGTPNKIATTSAVVINEIFYRGPAIAAKPGTPPTIESRAILEFNGSWRYDRSGNDLGANWAAEAHPAWPSGAGMLGLDTRQFDEPVNTAFERPVMRTNYFETEIDLPPAEFDSVDSLEIFHYIDDGAVFYVNGTEVERFKMPDGPIDFETLASSGGEAELNGPVVVSGELLQAGSNRISVEVHQNSPTSSDIIFGARVFKNVATTPAIPAIPFTESDEQWIELHNRSEQPVDLSGWSFGDGIQYVFEDGVSLPANGRLVLARDAELVQSLHPGLDVHGEFNGRLSQQGERIELNDANRNPVDRVRYHDGGRWPGGADGGGSSLELRDPDADNAVAEAWAPSNESDKTKWRTYVYSGEASRSRVGPDNQWREFNMGMLTAGEILIDDISVIEEPNGSAEELITDGGFDSGLEDWRPRGNHRHSEIIDDPDEPGNKVLRLVATGPTEHMSNQVETTLASRVSNGREYRISFRAKWITGGNQLHTRLYFNRMAKVNVIDRPATGGTPGARNSTAEPNIGPTFTHFLHSPAVPEPAVPTTVNVELADPDGVEAVTLFYSADGEPFQSIAMAASGAGSYEGAIPGQDAGTIVHFYAAATDQLGANSFYPRLGPESRAAYEVNDGEAATTELQNFRIVVTKEDRDWMHRDINVMSNDRVPGTVIYREDEIYYDIRFRLKGSERARSQNPRVGFNVRFNADQKFRGIHETASIDRSEGVGTGQFEMLFDVMMANSTGQMARYYDLIQIIAPQDRHVGGAVLQIGRYEDVFTAQFENGGEGTRYEYELVYYPTSADRDGNKRPQPDGVVGTPVRNLGDDEEDYRWSFLKKDHREADDFSAMIAYCKHFSKRNQEFEDGLEEVVDADQWLRGMAYAVLSGAGDNAGAGSQHNGMYYARPDGRVMFLPHDMDFAFDASRSITANPEAAKIARIPRFGRLYYGHLHDIATTTYNREYMQQWTDHFDELLPRQRWSSHLSYINSRSNNVLQQVRRRAAEVDFSVDADGPFQTSENRFVIEGEGWFNVREIRLAETGEALEVLWTDETDWQTTVPVSPGLNTYALEAVDFSGNLIGSAEFSITGTGSTAPASAATLTVSELHYHPADPTEEEIAAGFTDADLFEFAEVWNASSGPIDLTGVAFTAGVAFAFEENTKLEPNRRLVIVRDLAAFRARYPNVPETAIAGTFTGGLANNGESITLTDAVGLTIADFRYNDRTPWPVDADGAGYSLVLADQRSLSSPLGWRPSAGTGGTPGESDSIAFPVQLNAHADDDLDGSTNLAEYFAGTPPKTANGILFPSSGVIQYPVSLTSEHVTARLQSSLNLIDWSSVPEEQFDGLRHLGDSPTATATWNVPATGEYYRLLVTADGQE